MNKIMLAASVAVAAMSMVGCKSTNVDEWRSDLRTELCPAKFKPVYEVMKDKGLVRGEASASYRWWGFVGEGPDTFANEIGGPVTLKPGVKEATPDAAKVVKTEKPAIIRDIHGKLLKTYHLEEEDL